MGCLVVIVLLSLIVSVVAVCVARAADEKTCQNDGCGHAMPNPFDDKCTICRLPIDPPK